MSHDDWYTNEEAAALVLADHVQRGPEYCSCGAAIGDPPSHLAGVLAEAGLLAPKTPPLFIAADDPTPTVWFKGAAGRLEAVLSQSPRPTAAEVVLWEHLAATLRVVKDAPETSI